MINEDYADFVSLSTQLINVDGAVARMQKPLTDLRVPLPAWSPSPSGPYQRLSAAPRAARHPHGSIFARAVPQYTPVCVLDGPHG